MKKRILALLLAVVMIAGMIPTIAAVNPMPARVIRPDTTLRATYTFYVGDEDVSTQIVKNGEKLTEPAAPDGEGKFLGWYVEGEHTPLNFTEAVTVTATTEVLRPLRRSPVRPVHGREKRARGRLQDPPRG